MFAENKDAALAGMYAIHNDGQNHYDALCPHCQRAVRVSDERMKETYPNWEEEYKEMMARADKFEKKQAKLEKLASDKKVKPKKEKKKRKRKR
jgi:hypothetical protein